MYHTKRGKPRAATMNTRCHWQCCGCKAIFPSEKNAKLHVNFHIRADRDAALLIPPTQRGPGRLGLPPPRPAGTGRGVQVTGPGPGTRILAASQVPTRSHWPLPAAAAAGPGPARRYYCTMVLINHGNVQELDTGGPGIMMPVPFVAAAAAIQQYCT